MLIYLLAIPVNWMNKMRLLMQVTKIPPNLVSSIFTITERIKIFANVLHWTSFLEWREDPRGKRYDDISDSPVWALSI